jgi:hypothetical protein
MSDTSIDLNGVRCLSVRLVTCWKGAWFADCDLDPDSTPVTSADVPSGKVTITIAPPGATAITLTGFVDPNAAGRMVSSVPVRVIGGYGWAQSTAAQHFHSDGGVSSITVEQATAAGVGETVVDASPALLGVDWVRTAGPASSVFADRDWYVDTNGVTQVASRPTATPDPTVELLEWDPKHQHGTLAGDALVLPGTVITDPRFDGPITVRDVAQTWDRNGTRVEIWCGASAAGRIISALTNMVRQLGQIATLKRYRYRIITQNSDGRLVLQALPNPDGSKTDAPDVNPVSVAPGMSGLSALYKLSSECTLALVNGDPAQAFVESFDGAVPLEVTITATGVVHVGPTAGVTVKLAEGAPDYNAANVARNGDTCTVMLPPECPMVGTVGGLPFVGAVTFAFPCPGVINSGASEILG